MIIEIPLNQDTIQGFSGLWLIDREFSHNFGGFFTSKIQLDRMRVSGIVNINRCIGIVLVLPLEGRLQTIHLVLFAVNQDLQEIICIFMDLEKIFLKID